MNFPGAGGGLPVMPTGAAAASRVAGGGGGGGSPAGSGGFDPNDPNVKWVR